MNKDWHNHDGYRAIYLAALTGIYANPVFHGPLFQGSSEEAHKQAKLAVAAAIADNEGESDE